MQRVAMGLAVVLAAVCVWWVLAGDPGDPQRGGGAATADSDSVESTYDRPDVNAACAEVLGFVKSRYGDEGLQKVRDAALARGLTPEEVMKVCQDSSGLDGDALIERVESYTGAVLR